MKLFVLEKKLNISINFLYLVSNTLKARSIQSCNLGVRSEDKTYLILFNDGVYSDVQQLSINYRGCHDKLLKDKLLKDKLRKDKLLKDKLLTRQTPENTNS